MNRTQKRDIQYSFCSSLYSPLHIHAIDDNWRKEKFTQLDLIIPHHIVQSSFRSDRNETDPLAGAAAIGAKHDGASGSGAGAQGAARMASIAEVRRWDDLCMGELLNKKIDEYQEAPRGQIEELTRQMQSKLGGDFRKMR